MSSRRTVKKTWRRFCYLAFVFFKKRFLLVQTPFSPSPCLVWIQVKRTNCRHAEPEGASGVEMTNNSFYALSKHPHYGYWWNPPREEWKSWVIHSICPATSSMLGCLLLFLLLFSLCVVVFFCFPFFLFVCIFHSSSRHLMRSRNDRPFLPHFLRESSLFYIWLFYRSVNKVRLITKALKNVITYTWVVHNDTFHVVRLYKRPLNTQSFDVLSTS